jgi:nucleotide-binding universal stress UspA family protein
MIRKILLGFDGSDSANQAFSFAVDLARKYGAEMHVLAVARPPEFGDEVETEAVIENSRRHYDKVLAPIKVKLAQEEFKTQFHVAVGHPAEQIVRYAEGHGVDHIVVGHRGHTMFERWLIGSVARQVIAYAHCAVTVVRTAARPA